MAQVSAGEVVYKFLPESAKRKFDLREDDLIFVAIPTRPHDLVSRNIAIGIRGPAFQNERHQLPSGIIILAVAKYAYASDPENLILPVAFFKVRFVLLSVSFMMKAEST
jgi:hypothetical protein